MPPELMKLLAQMLGGGAQQPQQQQPNVLDILQATDPDPVGTANKLSGLPSYAPGSQSPFNTGFFGPSATPEARLASQGSSAQNVWSQLGGMQGVNGQAVADLTGARNQMAASNGAPPRTDVGEVMQPTPIPVAPAPQVGSWMGDVNSGWNLIGPARAGEGGGSLLGSVPSPKTPTMPFETPFGVSRPAKPKAGRGAFNAGASAKSKSVFNY